MPRLGCSLPALAFCQSSSTCANVGLPSSLSFSSFNLLFVNAIASAVSLIISFERYASQVKTHRLRIAGRVVLLSELGQSLRRAYGACGISLLLSTFSNLCSNFMFNHIRQPMVSSMLNLDFVAAPCSPVWSFQRSRDTSPTGRLTAKT